MNMLSHAHLLLNHINWWHIDAPPLPLKKLYWHFSLLVGPYTSLHTIKI